MTRKVFGMDEVLAKHYNALIPEIEREVFRIAKSTVDVGVWLVGLSTGVIALMMSNSALRSSLKSYSFNSALILFSLVVLFGVLQRILFHIAEFRKWPLSLRLRGSLIGLTERTPIAQELQDFWAVNEIVERLREDFGVDYNFLIEGHATLEQARQGYRRQIEIHREFEGKGIAKLAEVLCAHYGLPKSEEENYFGLSSPKNIEDIRLEAQSVDKIFKWSNVSYYLSAASFILGIVTLVYGAI